MRHCHLASHTQYTQLHTVKSFCLDVRQCVTAIWPHTPNTHSYTLSRASVRMSGSVSLPSGLTHPIHTVTHCQELLSGCQAVRHCHLASHTQYTQLHTVKSFCPDVRQCVTAIWPHTPNTHSYTPICTARGGGGGGGRGGYFGK